MDPVSHIGQLVATLRKRLADPADGKSAPAQTSSSTASTTAASSGGAARLQADALQRKIRDKLQHIDPADPKALPKSVHVFLESVLLWEFGNGLMKDPKFYALLDDVQHTMEADPQTRDNLAVLIDQLRNG